MEPAVDQPAGVGDGKRLGQAVGELDRVDRVVGAVLDEPRDQGRAVDPLADHVRDVDLPGGEPGALGGALLDRGVVDPREHRVGQAPARGRGPQEGAGDRIEGGALPAAAGQHLGRDRPGQHLVVRQPQHGGPPVAAGGRGGGDGAHQPVAGREQVALAQDGLRRAAALVGAGRHRSRHGHGPSPPTGGRRSVHPASVGARSRARGEPSRCG